MDSDEIKTNLSLIMPSYKKRAILIDSISNVLEVLDRYSKEYELILVIDGDTDGSLKEISRISHNCLKIISYVENKGKGAAIRNGFQVATGKYIGYMDVGLDIDPGSLIPFLREMENTQFDALIANRNNIRSIYESSVTRIIYSKIFRVISQLLFINLRVIDTQVGLKIFNGSSLRKVIPFLKEEEWLIDLDILQNMIYQGSNKFISMPVMINMNKERDSSESKKIKNMIKIFCSVIILSFRIGRGRQIINHVTTLLKWKR